MPIGFRDARHYAAFISRHHIKLADGPAKSALALVDIAEGHSVETAERLYGIDARTSFALTTERQHGFKLVCQAYHGLTFSKYACWMIIAISFFFFVCLIQPMLSTDTTDVLWAWYECVEMHPTPRIPPHNQQLCHSRPSSTTL